MRIVAIALYTMLLIGKVGFGSKSASAFTTAAA
jgi:hypothetical protein